MRRLLIVPGLLAAAATACGGAPSATNTTVNITQNEITELVFVNWGEQQAGDEVDFSDPRLMRAVNETAQLVGHRVEFHFDVATMPRPMSGFFDNLFERYVGRIPRDLERLKGRDMDVFGYGATALREIHFDYDGSVRRPDIRLDAEPGVLWLRMSPSGELVPEGAVTYAFTEAYRAHLAGAMDGLRAEDVPVAELPTYFRWLEGQGFRGDVERRASALRNATVVYARSQEAHAELHAEVREWLVRRGGFFSGQYIHHGDELRDLPSGSPWFAAEVAWAGWVNERWNDLDDQQKRKVLDTLYIRRSGPGREVDPYRREVFPGIDPFALSLRVIDSWVSFGRPRPYPVTSRDHRQSLFDFVVCAPRRTGRNQYQRARCDSDFYRHAATDPELRLRLFAEIGQRNDADLTEALFANLKWVRSPYLIDAWRHFEDNAAAWAIGTKVLADLVDYSRQDLRSELYDDSVRIWRDHPEHRGSLLYLLAAMTYPTRSQRSLVPWREFRRTFGSLASRQDFERFLANGDGALVRVAVVWPALARNANAIEALLPHLDIRMDDDTMRRRFSWFPHRMLADLIDEMREAGDRRSLTALRGYFERRSREHPSEERALATLIVRTQR